MSRRTPLAPLALAATLQMASPAFAQMLQDPALESLYRAERWDELQRVASTRLATQPDDAQAVLGVAVVALSRDDAAGRKAAIQRAEACVEKQPRAAPCQYALGVVLGIQAMSEGMWKAARSAGTVRDALQAANEIDPAWYPARSALSEFYLMLPAMMGGSNAKALELARSAPRPEQTRVLEARALAADKKYDAAVQAFASLPAIAEPELADDARGWASQCVLAMAAQGQGAKAQPLAEKLVRDHPRHAQPTYALARVKAEAGAHEEALKLYAQAATLKGADGLPLGWRVGISQQQLGQKEAARATFSRFVAAGKGPKNAIEDAKKRLGELGS
ncbi:MAG: hypothetical protein JNM33_06130 [Rubrivivax sp.]|nr:hypothetical protein [Rubrivivax sp.]